MHTLQFRVDKQTLTKQDGFDGLVAGTRGYLRARFAFSTDWAGHRKVAVFSCAAGEFAVLISGNICDVPDEVAACSSFKVRCVGRSDTSTLTSTRVTVIQRRY